MLSHLCCEKFWTTTLTQMAEHSALMQFICFFYNNIVTFWKFRNSNHFIKKVLYIYPDTLASKSFEELGSHPSGSSVDGNFHITTFFVHLAHQVQDVCHNDFASMVFDVMRTYQEGNSIVATIVCAFFTFSRVNIKCVYRWRWGWKLYWALVLIRFGAVGRS